MTDDIAKKIEAQILAQRPDGYTEQAWRNYAALAAQQAALKLRLAYLVEHARLMGIQATVTDDVEGKIRLSTAGHSRQIILRDERDEMVEVITVPLLDTSDTLPQSILRLSGLR